MNDKPKRLGLVLTELVNRNRTKPLPEAEVMGLGHAENLIRGQIEAEIVEARKDQIMLDELAYSVNLDVDESLTMEIRDDQLKALEKPDGLEVSELKKEAGRNHKGEN